VLKVESRPTLLDVCTSYSVLHEKLDKQVCLAPIHSPFGLPF
jgi:hypothetical protein